jgi:hypothetical protein
MDNLYYAITDSIMEVIIILIKIVWQLIKLIFIITKKTMSNIFNIRHGIYTSQNTF